MRAYFLRRLIFLVVTLFLTTTLSFVFLQLAPGSPIEMKLMSAQMGGGKSVLTEEAIKELKILYHFDRPIHERYAMWLWDVARLDFGTSFSDHRPVIEKIAECIPVSLSFGLISILVALLIGIPLGLVSGIWNGTFLDRSISIGMIALDSVPVYVVGILSLTFLAGSDFLGWFPVSGLTSDNYDLLSFGEKIADRISHFFLPALCYSLGGMAYIVQLQRSSMIETLGQDYIRTARAKGLSELKVFGVHAARNSLIPTATLIGGLIPGILGGGVIIEKIFSIPGLGLLAFDSLVSRDYPVIMANFLISSFLVLIGLLLSDLFYVLVDPRIEFGGSDD